MTNPDLADNINNTALFIQLYKYKLSDSERNAEPMRLTATNIDDSLQTWTQYLGQDILARRIEQNLITANLINEQVDLTSKNESIVNQQREQIKVVDRILDEYYNKGYSSLKNFESMEYKLNRLQFRASALKYAFVVLFVNMFVYSLTLLRWISPYASSITFVATTLVYCILFLVKYQVNRYRSKYNWDKMYFGAPEKNTRSCVHSNAN
jgi:uncharacterized membrane protein YjjP (DUF1212 family)